MRLHGLKDGLGRVVVGGGPLVRRQDGVDNDAVVLPIAEQGFKCLPVSAANAVYGGAHVAQIIGLGAAFLKLGKPGSLG